MRSAPCVYISYTVAPLALASLNLFQPLFSRLIPRYFDLDTAIDSPWTFYRGSVIGDLLTGRLEVCHFNEDSLSSHACRLARVLLLTRFCGSNSGGVNTIKNIDYFEKITWFLFFFFLLFYIALWKRWRGEVKTRMWNGVYSRLIVPLETCITVFKRVSRSRALKSERGTRGEILFLCDFSRVVFFYYSVHEVRDNVSRNCTRWSILSSGVWKVEGESEVEGNIL